MSSGKKRALKMSYFGALRRAKAMRRAYRCQHRYLDRLTHVNESIQAAIKLRRELLEEVAKLHDGLRLVDEPSTVPEQEASAVEESKQ